MTPALRLSNIATGFGGVPVLRDISFDLHAGELTVLAGENGAGKSTLMKIVTGQLKADAGEVVVAGSPLVQADPQAARRLGVGIVPQELARTPTWRSTRTSSSAGNCAPASAPWTAAR
ncbi:ABC transporter [Micromonospora pallida]|uniref:ABC transporter n=1 Tax=Micromonospora pallida TaxID=145854 RepID=A0A1C6RWP6_9ACTN|nr:ATP-binding cassette domain-containing protein [Micromonospora pallida]SCL21644.1 ABC transporter [Micromonospora pallida]